MKPTLCLFTDSSEPSGMGQHMLLLADELRSEYSISFVCYDFTHLTTMARERGYQTYSLPSGYWELVDLLKQLGPQVFHCHAGIGWEGQQGIGAARQAGIRTVVRTEHLPFLITDPQQRQTYLNCIEQVDALICVSHAARATFEQAGVEAHRLHTVQNGIRFAPEIAAESERGPVEGLPENALLALTVGRMTEQKGHCYLLEAVPTVLAEHPQAHFMLVGSGPLEQELRKQAARLDIEQNVHFTSKPVDIAQLMRACEIFVLPSLFEGLPLVALEAMSAGRPIVGTRVCGTEEAVEDGKTGLLVEPCNPQALAAGINRLLSDKLLAEQFGVAGRKRLEAHFTASRMARQTAKIYRSLAADRHSSQPGKNSDEPQDTNIVLLAI